MTDEQIDEAAHELQRVIVECGAEPTECAYDYLRMILAKLPAPVGAGAAELPEPAEDDAQLIDRLYREVWSSLPVKGRLLRFGCSILEAERRRAALAAPPGAVAVDAAPQPLNVEKMLEECVPGGSICDPQQVADAIRLWFRDAAPQQNPDSVHQVGATPQAAAALGQGTGQDEFDAWRQS